jgi:hypothetical protein
MDGIGLPSRIPPVGLSLTKSLRRVLRGVGEEEQHHLGQRRDAVEVDAVQDVVALAAGAHQLVDDRSRIHNFHLASNDDPAIDFRTDLDFVGQKSFTVTFRNNAVYAYACEPHWQVMNGSFLVTDGPAPPPPPPPPTPPPVRTLKASVTPAGAVRLGARSVRSGRYRIVVSDRSRSANFHLRGRGANARTGMAFRGTKTLRVRLSRGTYRYGSDRVGLSKRLRVR